MSVLDIKDRIPTNVLSNKAVRYGVYDEEGKLIRYEYIKREDEPLEEGTPINKFLLDNFQGDLYTQDRYNETTMISEVIQVQNSNGVYYAQYPQLTRPDNEEAVTIQAGKTCNGIGNVLLDRPVIVKQAKVTFYNDSNVDSIRLYGSNDGKTWTLVSTIATSTTKTEKYFEIANNTTTYKRYALYGYTTASPYNIYVYNFQITQWVETTGDDTTTTQTGELIPYMTTSPHQGEPTYKSQTIYINELNLPLTSYEIGKIVNIKGGRIVDESTVKYNTYTTDIIPKTWTKTSGDSVKEEYVAPDGTKIFSSSGTANNAFDGTNATSWEALDKTAGNNLGIIFTEPKRITKFRMQAYDSGNSNFQIQGSKNGSDWVTLKTASANMSQLTIVTLDNVDFYTQYRIYYPSATSVKPKIAEMLVYEWQTISGETTYINSFSKPYLNINNLGAKQINKPMNYGENYSLVYNGESWDGVGAKVTTGSFSATTTTKTISLGFTPDLVICYVPNNNNNKVAGGSVTDAGIDYVPRILTKAYFDSTNGRIVSNGFTYKVLVSATVYYLAIKL